jgi:hypothetical protein
MRQNFFEKMKIIRPAENCRRLDRKSRRLNSRARARNKPSVWFRFNSVFSNARHLTMLPLPF